MRMFYFCNQHSFNVNIITIRSQITDIYNFTLFRLFNFFFHLCTYYYLCTSGIWLHESGVLGASPDGFVQGDFHKTDIVHLQQNDQPATLPTIIEVKCPFTAKDKTIMEACSSVKDFFLGSQIIYTNLIVCTLCYLFCIT